MKKYSYLFLTLCMLLCTFTLLFTSCDQSSNPSQTDTATDNQNTNNIPAHDHVWENGVCKICSQKIPYELIFVSNGDGTCYVSNIKTDISFKSDFEIEIPQTSPNGDTVTAVKCEPLASSIPLVISIKDYEEISSVLKERVDNEELDRFNHEKFHAYFSKLSLNECKDDAEKKDLLDDYPITEITDIYALVDDASEIEKRWLSEFLWKNAQYAPDNLVEDYTHLYTVVNESSAENKEEILASLPKVPDNLGYHVTSLCFPNTINEIDFAWLSSCSRLEALNWPEQVTDIPDGTFDQFDNLLGNTYQNAIYIGNEQNPYLYLWKTADKDVTSASVHSNTKIIAASAFYRCKKLVSVTIPEGVTRIGKSAFHDCTALTNITIPNSITHIEKSTFSGCTSLASITIPNSVTSIGEQAFFNCSGLTSITIPNNVTSLGIYAFYKCTNLTSIIISNGVTSIDSYAFTGCTSLTAVYYEGTANEWASITIGFNNDPLKSATVYYYSETEPTDEGNYWHYVDGVPTAWN